MAAAFSAIEQRSSSALARYAGVYLVYVSTVVRILTRYGGEPELGLVAFLLAIYGLLLIFEPLLTSRHGWRPWAYLLLQSAVVIGLQLNPPRQEIVSTLFIPLSLQAVLFFNRRTGFVWIAAFTLAIADPVMASWDRTLPGVAMVLLYGALYSLVGHLAYLMKSAESARRENQRLIGELRVTHRQLEDYAAQMEEFAAAQERKRLARELHDSATQTIFSMNLTAQTARLLIERDPARVPEQLDRLQELACGAVGEIQELVDRLRPRAGVEDGLRAMLRRLVLEREARDGLQIHLEVTGEKDLPDPTVVGLCRIVQEALNNVAKHAGTREAVVRVNLAGPCACLEVEDRGVGFDPAAVLGNSGHVGLSGMADRATELGWKLSCESRPGHGTRIRAEEV